MSSKSGLAAAAAVVLTAGGLYWWQAQKRPEKPKVERVPLAAVLRAEDLTASGVGGAGKAFGTLVTRMLATQPGLRAGEWGTAAEAFAAGATHLVHVRLEPDKGGVRVVAAIEDTGAQKIEPLVETESGSGRWMRAGRAVAEAVARLSGAGGAVGDAGLPSEAAYEKLAALKTVQSQPDALAGAERLTAEYPACGWCWETRVAAVAAMGDREALLGVVQSALASEGVAELSRARMELFEADLKADAPARLKAVKRLVELTPSDVERWKDLAQSMTLRRDFAGAAGAWRSVAKLDPTATEALNQLGYLAAWQGRYEEAAAELQRYAQQEPSSPNPQDSLGEVFFMAGKFADAELEFVTSFEKDAAFNDGAAMEKAALAAMMRGDTDGARKRLDVFLKSRAERRDALVVWRQARWLYLLGDARQAVASLEKVEEGGPPVLRAFAEASLALWSMDAGERAKAAEHARRLSGMEHPAARQLGPFVSAAVGLQAAGERDLYQAVVALMLQDKEQEAARVLRRAIGEAVPGADQMMKEMLAWVMVREGRAREAGPLVKGGWPIPAGIQAQLTDFLVYPNLLYTRARIAQASGGGVSGRYFDLYLRLMGSRPERHGQKEEARAAVRL